MADESKSAVQVVVRLRPMNDKEKKIGVTPVISASEEHNTISVMKGEDMTRTIYSYNNVFTEFATQKEVFQDTLAPIIDDVLNGYESTVFAYGQTGTGKTHTMEGDLSDPVKYGVIPRSTDAIFRTLKKNKYKSYKVTCSYLEIYNEELCDLLIERNSHGEKLEIMNNKNGTFCRGLIQKEVNSSNDVLHLMMQAVQSRKIGETKMNKQSSRSHCIFTVNVQVSIKDNERMVQHLGRLHMVDLAGSECAKHASLESRQSVAGSARERERLNINRSLLTLGRVISAVKDISDGKKNTRVPYRDSKLTRILKEALGGRSKTLIIATVSPSEAALSESISTLNYAQSANSIINKPVSTTYDQVSSSRNRLSSSSPLADPTGAVEQWFELECKMKYMETQIEEAQIALARKEQQQQRFIDRAEKAEFELNEMEAKYEGLHEEYGIEQEKNRKLADKLLDTEKALIKTSELLDATKKTERNLTIEAKNLICTVKASIKDGDNLYQLLEESHEADAHRRKATQVFNSATTTVLEEVSLKLNAMANATNLRQIQINKNAHENYEHDSKSLEESRNLINDINSQVITLTQTMKNLSVNENGILPSLACVTEDAQDGIEVVMNGINTAEKSIENFYKTSCEKLHSSSKLLEIMDQEYNHATEALRTQIADGGGDTKKQLINMVNDIIEKISTLSDSHVSTRDNLEVILSDLQNTALKVMKEIGRSALKQNGQSEIAMTVFTEGMKNNEELQRQMNEQLTSVDTQGKEQMKDLVLQSKLLLKQKQTFLKMKDMQGKIQSEIMSTVVKGVEQMLQREFGRLSEESENYFTTLGCDNDEIGNLKASIEASTQSIMTQIETKGNKVLYHANELQLNDTKFHDECKKTSETFVEIKEIAKNHHGFMAQLCERTTEKMTEMKHMDEPIANALKKCDSERKALIETIEKTMINSIDESVQGLKIIEKDKMHLVSTTMIPDINTDLSVLKAEQNDIRENLTAKMTEMKSRIDLGHDEVKNMTLEQISELDKLRNIVNSKSTRFYNDLIQPQQYIVDLRHRQMIESTENDYQLISGQLSTTNELVKDVDNNIHTFSKNEIRCDEDVPDMELRTKIIYEEKLSSTDQDLVASSQDMKQCTTPRGTDQEMGVVALEKQKLSKPTEGSVTKNNRKAFIRTKNYGDRRENENAFR